MTAWMTYLGDELEVMIEGTLIAVGIRSAVNAVGHVVAAGLTYLDLGLN